MLGKHWIKVVQIAELDKSAFIYGDPNKFYFRCGFKTHRENFNGRKHAPCRLRLDIHVYQASLI
jgi:hypothetical protein